MKKSIWLAVFALLPLAVSTSAMAELKIGFVHVPEVMDRMPEAAAAREKIQQEFAGKERELRQQQEQLEELQERHQRDSAVMSASEKQRLEQEIRDKGGALQQAQRALQQEVNQRGEQEMRQLQQKIGEAVDSIARSEGYDLILVEGVAHASDKVNITDQVVQKLTDDD